MRSLAVPLAVASAAVALAACSNGEYCVSPRPGSELCGAAARSWCDENSPERAAKLADPRTSEATSERLRAIDDACAAVGGL